MDMVLVDTGAVALKMAFNWYDDRVTSHRVGDIIAIAGAAAQAHTTFTMP